VGSAVGVSTEWERAGLGAQRGKTESTSASTRLDSRTGRVDTMSLHRSDPGPRSQRGNGCVRSVITSRRHSKSEPAPALVWALVVRFGDFDLRDEFANRSRIRGRRSRSVGEQQRARRDAETSLDINAPPRKNAVSASPKVELLAAAPVALIHVQADLNAAARVHGVDAEAVALSGVPVAEERHVKNDVVPAFEREHGAVGG
jgi:hypothetical protein